MNKILKIIIPPRLKKLVIEPNITEITFNNKFNFTVIGYDQYREIIEVSEIHWKCDSGSINNGIFLAGNKEQIITITAEVKQFLITIREEIKVKVIEPIFSLNIVPNVNQINLKPCESYQFKAQCVDQLGYIFTEEKIEWSFIQNNSDNNESIFGENYQISLPINAKGEYKVIAKVKNLTQEIKIYVPPILKQLKITPQTIDLKPKQGYQFLVYGLDQCGETININDSQLIWSCTSGNITKNGFFVGNYRHRQSTIKVRLDQFATTAIVNLIPILKGLKIEPEVETIISDKPIKFTAKGFDQFGQEIAINNLQWYANIGQIDHDGNYKPLHFDYKVKITVIADHIYQNLSFSIQEPSHLIRLKINPQSLILSANSFYQFQVSGLDQREQIIPIQNIKWSTNIGSINKKGLLQLPKKAKGNYQISAKVKNITSSAIIEIPAILTSIKIEPQTIDLKPKEECLFKIKGYDQSGDEIEVSSVTWSSSSGTILNNIFKGDDSARKVEITATVNSLKAIATVNLIPVLRSLKIEPEMDKITTDQPIQFTAKGIDQFGKNIAVNNLQWKANVGEINSNGLYKGVDYDTEVKITVTSEKFSSALTFSCYTPPRLTKLKVEPKTVNLLPNSSQKFKVIGLDQRNNEIKINQIKWSTNIEFLNINQDGLINIPNNYKGSCQIRVTIDDIIGTALISVPSIIKYISIEPKSIELEAEQEYQFTIKGLDQCDDLININNGTWSCNYGIIDENTGLFITDGSQKETTIIATYEQLIDTAKVTIKSVLNQLKITNNLTIIDSNQTVKFTAQGYNQFGEEIEVKDLKWSTNFGTIDLNGNYKAVNKDREVIITVTAKNINTSLTFLVREPSRLTTLKVEPQIITLLPDNSHQFKVIGLDQRGDQIEINNIKWSTNVKAINNNNGLVYIPNNYKGNCQVVAIVNNIIGQAFIDVPAIAKSLKIEPDVIRLKPNEEYKFEVIGKDQCGEEIDKNQVEWSCDYGFIEDNTGFFITDGNEKEAIITATIDDCIAIAIVEIIPVLKRLEISPQIDYYLLPNTSIQFYVKGYDQFGDKITVNNLQWETNIGTINPNGKYIANSHDAEVRVTAKSENIKTYAIFNVREPSYLSKLEVEPRYFNSSHQFEVRALDQRGDRILINQIKLTIDNGEINDQTGMISIPNNYKGNFKVTASFNQINLNKTVNIPPILTSFKIIPEETEFYPKEKYYFALNGYDQTGDLIPINTTVKWKSSWGGKINQYGLFTGKYNRKDVTITAIVENFPCFSSNYEITKKITLLPVLRKLKIKHSSCYLTPEEKVKFTVKGYDQFDKEINTNSLLWESSKGNLLIEDFSQSAILLLNPKDKGDVIIKVYSQDSYIFNEKYRKLFKIVGLSSYFLAFLIDPETQIKASFKYNFLNLILDKTASLLNESSLNEDDNLELEENEIIVENADFIIPEDLTNLFLKICRGTISKLFVSLAIFCLKKVYATINTSVTCYIISVLKSIKIKSSATEIMTGKTIQFEVIGLDQAEEKIEIRQAINWATTHGKITNDGILSIDNDYEISDNSVITITANVENFYDFIEIKVIKSNSTCLNNFTELIGLYQKS